MRSLVKADGRREARRVVGKSIVTWGVCWEELRNWTLSLLEEGGRDIVAGIQIVTCVTVMGTGMFVVLYVSEHMDYVVWCDIATLAKRHQSYEPYVSLA